VSGCPCARSSAHSSSKDADTCHGASTREPTNVALGSRLASAPTPISARHRAGAPRDGGISRPASGTSARRLRSGRPAAAPPRRTVVGGGRSRPARRHRRDHLHQMLDPPECPSRRRCRRVSDGATRVPSRSRLAQRQISLLPSLWKKHSSANTARRLQRSRAPSALGTSTTSVSGVSGTGKPRSRASRGSEGKRPRTSGFGRSVSPGGKGFCKP
jgi:hypothetical protein